MKRKKLTVFALILSIILLFGNIGNIIMMNITESHSEKNTTEFVATVMRVEIVGEGTYKRCIIHSEEYGDKLDTYNIRGIVDMSNFTSLNSNQTIYFRTKNSWVNQFEEMSFIPIVSLRTEEKEIVSLSSYNEFMAPSLYSATIAGIVVTTIFLLTSIHCVLLLKGFNVFHRFKK